MTTAHTKFDRVLPMLATLVLTGAILTATAAADDAKPKPLPPQAVSQATEIFNGRCTPCHGPMGKGDGPASAGLTPKPRNFSDPEWQKAISDEQIDKIIKFGGAAVGKSPMMPGNPDLTAKPEVVRALVAHVRSLAAAKP